MSVRVHGYGAATKQTRGRRRPSPRKEADVHDEKQQRTNRSSGAQSLGAETVCRGGDSQVSDRIRQPEAVVRGTSRGRLPDRGDRPPEAPTTRTGRSDSRDPYTGPEAAGAY